MHTTIRFKIKKEIDTPTARKILKLKGSLIAQSYTDIIHFDDEEEDFYVHYFQLDKSDSKPAADFIRTFSEENDLVDIVILL
ncbi:hypothetical protein [Flavobacterium sp. fv08]|uniref:hypothetical protein n=1 Tax=Flavobacterium sp. fv08 TaxID=1761784 RepID=UPI0008B66E12|nr:hypothetical protein [Flavobacterium sp. fv08]SEP06073.1 hypothetical protein SAMN04487978_4348 [Flavobacterium sp. fv08]